MSVGQNRKQQMKGSQSGVQSHGPQNDRSVSRDPYSNNKYQNYNNTG